MNISSNIVRCLCVCVLLTGGCSERPEEKTEGTGIKGVRFTVSKGPAADGQKPGEKTAPAEESQKPPEPPEKDRVIRKEFQPSAEATEIVRKSDDLMRGQSLEGLYAMEVVTPGWTRRIKMRVWDKGRTKTFIRILEPAKEAGIATLRTGDEMWNYLPEVEQTVKIPPSMMGQPWMGSDFANDDLVNETSVVDDYTHGVIDETTVDGEQAYIIELRPKEGAAVPWGKLIFTIRKDFIPVTEEYFNERDELIKTLEYSRVWEMSDRRIPTIWKMVSHTRDGHHTIIEVMEAEYNKDIPDNIFTLRNLRRGR